MEHNQCAIGVEHLLWFIPILSLGEISGAIFHTNMDAWLVAVFLPDSLEGFQVKESCRAVVAVPLIRMRRIDVLRHPPLDQLNQRLNDDFTVVSEILFVDKIVGSMIGARRKHEKVFPGLILKNREE